MAEYISREEAIDKIKSLKGTLEAVYDWDIGYNTAIARVVKHIKRMSVADVQTVRRGRWVIKGQEIYCSECDTESSYNPFGASQFTHFCPHCGADMRGGANGT